MEIINEFVVEVVELFVAIVVFISSSCYEYFCYNRYLARQKTEDRERILRQSKKKIRSILHFKFLIKCCR